MRSLLAWVVLYASTGALLGCAREAVTEEPPKAAAGQQVVAVLGSEKLTLAEVDQQAGEGNLAAIREKEYELRHDALERMLEERLFAQEAKARGISVDELLKREVEAKLHEPDEAEVSQLYEQNKIRFGSLPKAAVEDNIRAAVRSRDRAQRRAAFRRELMKKSGARILLEPPRRVVSVPASAPALGPAKAPITMVEYADYQCPYCKRAQATVEEVLKRYAGRIRFVHRDFPLDFHPGALPAARAANCAGEQGKFWEYHRSLLEQDGKLDDADLKARASSLGLNVTAFESCLAYPQGDAPIRASIAEGQKLGVAATPTFFINGREVSGARPLEAFTDVIDDELDRAR
jgi:protein-disulfide isomerase